MMKTGALVAGMVMALLAPGAAHAERRETLYAVGDSITLGAKLDHHMHTRYAAKLRNHGYRIRVVAHGGQCLLATNCGYGVPLVETFRREVLRKHPKPDRIVLSIGVNDLAHVTDRQMHNAYLRLRREARAAGIKVNVATITPTATTFAMYPREWVEPQRLRINRWIKRTWPETHIDFAAALEGPDGSMLSCYDSGDGLHPNELGALTIAKAVREKLGLTSRPRTSS